MNLFIAIPIKEDAEKIEAKLKEHFTDQYMQIPGRDFPIWIVASNRYVSAEIAKILEIDPTLESKKRKGGFIAEIRNHYGYDYPEIWQKLEAWRQK